MCRFPHYIPVVFHNLSGYDAHLFIRELAASIPGGARMGVIAKTKEDYISFSIKVAVDKYIDKNGIEKDKEIELRFINSFKFMSSSLDSLTSLYEYKSSWDRFEETVFPPPEVFCSKLNMAGVSSEDYEHARSVWKESGSRNLGEYHDLYLKTFVLLLANVFEAFRGVCLKNYDLHPSHFYTAPGLAFKACLKKTRIRLELLLNPDMLLMFERGTNYRITESVHRWARANGPYMGSKFNPDEATNFLQHLDANNLYRWAMPQPLPTGGFPWVEVEPAEISRPAKLMSKGYLLKVNVRYPKAVQDSHNDLPFMCERLKIGGVEKLVPSLFDKKCYVIHIRALDQALRHKLVLEGTHRAIEFDQSASMKDCIDFNTQLRTAATNDF